MPPLFLVTCRHGPEENFAGALVNPAAPVEAVVVFLGEEDFYLHVRFVLGRKDAARALSAAFPSRRKIVLGLFFIEAYIVAVSSAIALSSSSRKILP